MKKILDVLAGNCPKIPPIWMMRQAGRYLPEYRDLRGKAGSFLNLCYNPEHAAEVTLQPIRRFGFDAAILFADILLVPHAMGCDLAFETGEGPVMTPVASQKELNQLKVTDAHEELLCIGDTVKLVANALDEKTTLIGFAGAPWTVATYMVGGRGGEGQRPARVMMRENPQLLHNIMSSITEVTIEYLAMQARCGAEVLKIFDSWASDLTLSQFDEFVCYYHRTIIDGLRAKNIEVPIIGLPKGASAYLDHYINHVPCQAVALDTSVNPLLIRENFPVQGNLDPLSLIVGGASLEREVTEILDKFAGRPHIFNLSHGIKPETPIAHVERMIELVRS